MLYVTLSFIMYGRVETDVVIPSLILTFLDM